MTSFSQEKHLYQVLIDSAGADKEALAAILPQLHDAFTVESVLRHLLLDSLGAEVSATQAAKTFLERMETFHEAKVLGVAKIFPLIEFLFEMLDLEDFESVFSWMEDECDWLTRLTLAPGQVPAVVRSFNVILKRLSRTHMGATIGRVRLFLDRITGLGVHSHYASAPHPRLLVWDTRENFVSSDEKITYELYEAVWKMLNQAHQTHNTPLEKVKDDEWRSVRKEVLAVLKEIEDTAVRVAQIWKVNAENEASSGPPRRLGEETLARDVDSAGFFSTNYLTSGRVFAQQFMDPAFRRQILTELLGFLQTHSIHLHVKVDNDRANEKKEDAIERERLEKEILEREAGKKPAPVRDRLGLKEARKKETELLESKNRLLQRNELDELIEKTRKLIERTPPFGKRYLNMIDGVFAREKRWVAWKAKKYTPIVQEKPAEDLSAPNVTEATEMGEPPAKRRKIQETVADGMDGVVATAENFIDFGNSNLNDVFNSVFVVRVVEDKVEAWSEEPEEGEALSRWRGIRARMDLDLDALSTDILTTAYDEFTVEPSFRDTALRELHERKQRPGADAPESAIAEADQKDSLMNDIQITEDDLPPAMAVTAPVVKPPPPQTTSPAPKRVLDKAARDALLSAPLEPEPVHAKPPPVIAAPSVPTPKAAPPKPRQFAPVPVPVRAPQAIARYVTAPGALARAVRERSGSVEIQKILAESNPQLADVLPFIYNDLGPELYWLALDQFGNFVVQRLIDAAPTEMVQNIVDLLMPHIIEAAMNSHGTRVVQKMLERSTPDQVLQAKEIIAPAASRLMFDQNGTHVMLKCIDVLPSEQLEWLIDLALPRFMELGHNNFGCRVLQKLIEKVSATSRSRLMVAVIDHAPELIRDAYGNYVVQCVLNLKLIETIEAIVITVLPLLGDLCRNKFASPAIEKSLKVGNERTVKMICRELFSDPIRLPMLIGDKFGNYVVQTALEQSKDKTPDDFRAWAEIVRQALPHVWRINQTAARVIDQKLQNLFKPR